MIKRYLPYIGPLIGATGLSLALYFHAQSIQERIPYYYVGSRATIVDSSTSTPSPLQVLYKGHPTANSNVVTMEVYVWNGGKLPIRAEDVLEPLSVELANSEILEARILHISRSVTKFEMLPISESRKNVLPLSFSILEKSDGAAIQIIYAGMSDAPVSARGIIVGAGAPRLFSGGRPERSPEEALRRWNRFDRIMMRITYGTSGLLSLILAAVLLLRSRQGRFQLAPGKAFTIMIVVLWIMYLGMDVTTYFELRRPEIPSGIVSR